MGQAADHQNLTLQFRNAPAAEDGVEQDVALLLQQVGPCERDQGLLVAGPEIAGPFQRVLGGGTIAHTDIRPADQQPGRHVVGVDPQRVLEVGDGPTDIAGFEAAKTVLVISADLGRRCGSGRRPELGCEQGGENDNNPGKATRDPRTAAYGHGLILPVVSRTVNSRTPSVTGPPQRASTTRPRPWRHGQPSGHRRIRASGAVCRHPQGPRRGGRGRPAWLRSRPRVRRCR